LRGAANAARDEPQEFSANKEQPVDSTAVSQQDIEIGLHDSFDFAAVTILFEHQGDEESSRCNTVRPVGWKRSPAMLVLSRQRDESIIIGDNIVITIVDIRGDKVRLGIEAKADAEGRARRPAKEKSCSKSPSADA
jgi:hypothetical protein